MRLKLRNLVGWFWRGAPPWQFELYQLASSLSVADNCRTGLSVHQRIHD